MQRKYTNYKQPSRIVLRKKCSENMHQSYMRTHTPKCGFNKVTLHWCSPVNSLHILRMSLPKNTSGWLLEAIRETLTSIDLKVCMAEKNYLVLKWCYWQLYILQKTSSWVGIISLMCNNFCFKKNIRNLAEIKYGLVKLVAVFIL